MNKKEFFKGMGMGMIAGGALVAACMHNSPHGKKGDVKSRVGRIAKTLSGIIEDFAEAVGM